MIWLFGVLQENGRLKDALTQGNPDHKDSGNFQKVQVLILFSLIGEHSIQFPHYGYCNSSLCDKGSRLNNLVGLVSLKAVIYYIYYCSTSL